MKIAFLASEMVPFAKTGGLADVVGSLAVVIQGLGHEVAAFLPRYKSVDLQKLGAKQVADNLQIAIGSDKETGKLFHFRHASGVDVYFIDHPGFYQRDFLYGLPAGDYPDNDRRFIFFQRAALQGMRAVDFKPEVIHCHDWQTGLMPTYLKTLYAGDSFFNKTKSVFTIHNLGYQGNFPPDSLGLTGLSWDQFKMERLEFYGKISFMKAALLDADTLTTVSERYAREIQSVQFGCGMEGVLAKRKDQIQGIINGIDPEEWDPEKDTDLAARFNLSTFEKKSANKAALQKENHLALEPKVPLAGVVSRLVDQKGIDILVPALGAMVKMGMQVVIVGTGEEKYHHVLRDIAKKNKGSIAVHILFDTKMAKRVYGGADMFLVPSFYEPCGLGQLIAMRYGTVPVVRETGGLADTVQPYDIKSGSGNGFSFQDYSSEALLASLERAVAIYKNDKKWHEVVSNAMNSDYSWEASARKYVRVYESTKRRAAAERK